MIAIGLVGMPGSGKGTIAKTLEANGFAVIGMGGIVRHEFQRRYQREANAFEQISFGQQLRKQGGLEVMARLSWREFGSFAEDVDYRGCIFDGIRSMEEDRWFRQNLPDYRLVHVAVPAAIRYKRLIKRTDREMTLEQAYQRDQEELKAFAIGSVIARSDVTIDNSGAPPSLEQLLHLLTSGDQKQTA